MSLVVSTNYAFEERMLMDSYLDQEKCCKNFDCHKLGNGQCDQILNLKVCAWDAGDCGFCNSGCYFGMIGNGICDINCNVEDCHYDRNDCNDRVLVDTKKDKEKINVTINDDIVTIGKNIETIYGSLKFDNIEKLDADIKFEYINLNNKKEGFSETNLNYTTIVVTGDFYMRDLNIYGKNIPKRIDLKIEHHGLIDLNNICFDNYISIVINDKNINSTINEKSIEKLSFEQNSNKTCLNFRFSLVNGQIKPLFSENSSTNTFKLVDKNQTTSISEFSSTINTQFILENNSTLSIQNSNFTNFSPALFTLSSSMLSISSSNFEYLGEADFSNSKTPACLFFSMSDSNATLIDSDINDCQGMKVASLSNSSLTVQNINFTNCSFEPMKNISKMTICDNDSYCKPSQISSKSCPDGQMDLIVCTKCPDNYYRFQYLENLFCFKCPESMNCSNGKVKPAKDYYQFEDNNLKHIFRPCFRNESCKDPASSKWALDDQCENGYTGNFCASCDNNYTSIGKYKCGKCPNVVLNGFLIVISIAVVSAFIIYLIKTTVVSSFEPSEFYSIAIRIGINYFQVIYLCLQFRITWPSATGEKNDGNSAGETFKESSNYYFSLQCLIEGLQYHKDYYYGRVTFMAILPIILFIFSITYLTVLRIWNSKISYQIRHLTRNLEKYKPSNLTIYTPVTFILPFLLIYPYVITYTLSPLACDSLENTKPQEYPENIDYSKYKFVMEDPDITCNWEDHYRKIIWATGFSLIVWGFGVPIFIFYKLYQKRKNLFEYEVKYTFGFLISGYLHERFYWEFIIFIKKLMIVFLTVFMQTGYSITLQSILLITFLIAGFILQIYFKPYITDELNQLEIAGTLAATITVLAAIIYTESNESSIKLQLFLVFIMIVVNCFYILYWVSFTFKQLFTYIISNIDFLKKRFLKRDGFNRDISKEYKNVDFVYIKEYQKLFTQTKFNEALAENYLGDEPSYDKLMRNIIGTPLKNYESNNGPNFRSIKRQPTFQRFNSKK